MARLEKNISTEFNAIRSREGNFGRFLTANTTLKNFCQNRKFDQEPGGQFRNLRACFLNKIHIGINGRVGKRYWKCQFWIPLPKCFWQKLWQFEVMDCNVKNKVSYHGPWPWSMDHDLKLSHFFQKKTSKKCDNFTQKVPFLDYNKTKIGKKCDNLECDNLRSWIVLDIGKFLIFNTLTFSYSD